MNIELIEAGRFYADGGAMFGAIPKTVWSRKYPSDERNGCVLTMRCVLIQADCGKKILIDTGAGNKQLDRLSYYRFFNLIDFERELNKREIALTEITDVILTHLHFDHCGYVTRQNPENGNISPTFPNATCWVSSSQWENFLQPNPLEQNSYFPENLLPIQTAGKLRLINADTKICKGVSLRLYNGHTPGQIVPYLTKETQTYIFAGDVVPLAASVSPEWISAYDTDPVTSYHEKVRLLEEAANKEQIILYCHDAYTAYSKIKKINNFYKVELPCKGVDITIRF